ncbi:MAG: DUF456 domain-containing protein [Anaerolineales bacterium]|nr:DUF456 domain-containing protein [Anaerolineales bacterium]
MTEWMLLSVVVFLMLLGLAGVLLPLLPGIELIWLAALGYGILNGFTWGGALAMGVITLLLLAGLSSDIWITGLGLKSAGTSLGSMLLGGMLLVFGSLLLTPLAGILLGLAALAALEYRRHRDWRKAAASAGTALAGCGLSFGVKLLIGLAMIGVWVLWVLRG